jgi:hypothetical protein
MYLAASTGSIWPTATIGLENVMASCLTSSTLPLWLMCATFSAEGVICAGPDDAGFVWGGALGV